MWEGRTSNRPPYPDWREGPVNPQANEGTERSEENKARPKPMVHGRVTILVNEHTASAGEMVAAFRGGDNLAIIIGGEDSPRLLSSTVFKAGFGYIVGLPVAAYLTWQGKLDSDNARLLIRRRRKSIGVYRRLQLLGSNHGPFATSPHIGERIRAPSRD